LTLAKHIAKRKQRKAGTRRGGKHREEKKQEGWQSKDVRANKKEQLEFSAHQMLLATTTVKLYRPSCFRFVQHHTAPQASAKKVRKAKQSYPNGQIRTKQVEVNFPKSSETSFFPTCPVVPFQPSTSELETHMQVGAYPHAS